MSSPRGKLQTIIVFIRARITTKQILFAARVIESKRYLTKVSVILTLTFDPGRSRYLTCRQADLVELKVMHQKLQIQLQEQQIAIVHAT